MVSTQRWKIRTLPTSAAVLGPTWTGTIGAQYAVSRSWFACGRGLVQNRPADAPIQKRLGGLESLVCRNGSAPLLDRRDKLNHVPLGDLVNTPTAPGRPNF